MHAAIYIRKSREDKSKDAHRLELQRTDLPKHAELKGWTYEVYDDGYASASRSNLANLKERNRMERDIHSGKVDVVLVIEISRLSRDDTLIDYVTWLAMCGKYNVKLATKDRVLDPNNPSDQTLLIVEGGFSSAESKRINIRMAEGRYAAFLAGKWRGSIPPRPYVYDGTIRKMVVDQTDLKIFQRIWALIETNSTKKTAEILKQPHSTVRRAVSDARLDFYQAQRHHPESGEVINCEWEAVLTAEQAARIRLGRKSRGTNNKSTRPNSLLSGLNLLKCGYCGHTAKTWGGSNIRKDGTVLRYYGCASKDTKGKCEKSRSIPQLILNEKLITNVFNTVACLEDLINHWLASQSDHDHVGKLKRLESEKKTLKQQNTRLVKVVMEGILSLDEVAKEKRKIGDALATVQDEINELESRQLSPPDWESLLLTREEFEYLDRIDQRRFLVLILDQIRVYDTYAILNYKFPRTSSGDCTARIHLPPPQRGPSKGRKPRIAGSARPLVKK